MTTKAKTKTVASNKKVVTNKQKGKEPDIRERITELRETIEQSWFEISILLKDIYENNMFEEWGYSSFEDYVKSELDLEYRNAMYRVKIGQTISELEISKEQIAGLGWTKFKEIIPILMDEKLGLTKSKINKIIKAVEPMSFRETKELVSKIKEEQKNGKTADVKEISKSNKVKFSFNDEQLQVVKEAISVAKEMIDTDNDSLALEYICAEWLAQQMGEDEEEIDIDID
jgi:hypothetical protein